MNLGLDAAARQVLLDHEGDLEGDGVVELTQVETSQLLDFLQAVHQRVAVEKHTKKKALWPNWKPHVQPANSKLFVWKLKIQANVRKLSC